MNILITGGTGFFGKSIISYLNKKYFDIEKIFILSRKPEKLNDVFDIKDFPFETTFISQDIRDPIKINEPVDYVIHAAAESSTSVGVENPMLMRNVVVEGTKNVLEYAKMQNVKRVIFISSGAIYGKQPEEITHIPEDYPGAPDPLNPFNSYGCAKHQAENLCALYHHHYDVDYVVARCFAFVGPFLPLNAHFAIGNFIRDGMNGGPIIVKGDGTTVRSYLYADDMAEWLLTILKKGKIGEAYNVGSDEAITMADLAHLVNRYFGNKLEVIIQGTPNAKVDRYVPKVEKIYRELSVTKKVSLADGIKRKIAFHKKINIY